MSADLAVSNPTDRDERPAAAARRAVTGAPMGEAGPGRPDTARSSTPPGSVVQRDLAAYTREHVTGIPTGPQGPPLMETATADAPGIATALLVLVSAAKVSVRPVQDTLQFSDAGATRAEVVAALAAGGYPKAAQMADMLMDPHRIAVYSHEEVIVSPGLLWDDTFGRTQQNLETKTTRGLTSAERKAAESVYCNTID